MWNQWTKHSGKTTEKMNFLLLQSIFFIRRLKNVLNLSKLFNVFKFSSVTKYLKPITKTTQQKIIKNKEKIVSAASNVGISFTYTYRYMYIYFFCYHFFLVEGVLQSYFINMII